MALVNGYPIISEKSIAPARSKTICFVQSQKKNKKPRRTEWPGRGGRGRELENGRRWGRDVRKEGEVEEASGR